MAFQNEIVVRRDDGRNGRLRLPLPAPRRSITDQLRAATQARRTGSTYIFDFFSDFGLRTRFKSELCRSH